MGSFIKGLLWALVAVFVIGVFLFGNSAEDVGLWVHGIFVGLGGFVRGIGGGHAAVTRVG
jgi:hypothetical protein